MDKLVIKGVRGLADALEVSTATAMKLIRTQGFPCGKVGKLVCIPVPQLLEWLANGGTEQKGA